MTTIIILSNQPKCKYCGAPLSEWNPFVNDSDQAHPECEGEAMAIGSIEMVRRDIEEMIRRME